MWVELKRQLNIMIVAYTMLFLVSGVIFYNMAKVILYITKGIKI